MFLKALLFEGKLFHTILHNAVAHSILMLLGLEPWIGERLSRLISIVVLIMANSFTVMLSDAT
jgi:hypothetical protein